ncbi:class I SAM-dependent methyltransferase [Marinobacter sp. W-8]|uniref:class I SAM-dependent methyltransferase n=1 Tax=Marinobacter sp. W-8 TaxID=3369658 RepID=UPI0037CA3B6F
MKLDVYGRHIPRQSCRAQTTLLDVGCGSGDFLMRAKEMGLSAIGCEPDEKAVVIGRRRGLNIVAGNLESAALPLTHFDYITLNHVIEHVINPQTTLTKLHELIAPSGWLWMALPNPDAIGLHCFKQGWKGFHPPYHLLIPSQKVLHDWLRSAGFINIKLVRRGAQSSNLWTESVALSRREGCSLSMPLNKSIWLLSNLLSTCSARWGEETIIMAQRPGKHT